MSDFGNPYQDEPSVFEEPEVSEEGSVCFCGEEAYDICCKCVAHLCTEHIHICPTCPLSFCSNHIDQHVAECKDNKPVAVDPIDDSEVPF